MSRFFANFFENSGWLPPPLPPPHWKRYVTLKYQQFEKLIIGHILINKSRSRCSSVIRRKATETEGLVMIND